MHLKDSGADLYFSRLEKWQDELAALRVICLDCGLTEMLKWNIPVYTAQGKNIAGINGLKEFCAISFFKGALLQDRHKILTRPGEVQAGRWIKFTSVNEIADMEPVIKDYIHEAIEVEMANLKIIKKQTSDYPVPSEFQARLDAFPELKAAYENLTPGRQRGYLVFFLKAKQSKTRKERIEKHIPDILQGKGLFD